MARAGTFLLLEKVKILVYRNLFKKIYLAQHKATQLKLEIFARASVQRRYRSGIIPLGFDREWLYTGLGAF